jgi:hypothetical protein
LEIIALFNDFIVHHVARNENIEVNNLAQQASGFWSNRGKLYVLKKMDVPIYQTGWSDFWPMQSAEIYSDELDSAKPDGNRMVRNFQEFEQIKQNDDDRTWWLEDTPGMLFWEPWPYCW